MLPLPFADSFLTGSLLTICLPLGLLIGIAVWYIIEVRRVPADTPTSSPSLPPPRWSMQRGRASYPTSRRPAPADEL